MIGAGLGRMVRRLRSSPFEVLLGTITVIVAIQFFIDPHTRTLSPVGRLVGRLQPWDDVWNAAYLAGGVMLLIGSAFDRYDVIVGGLFFVAGSLAIQVVALAVVGRWMVAVSIGTNLFVIVLCLARAKDIFDAARDGRPLKPLNGPG